MTQSSFLYKEIPPGSGLYIKDHIYYVHDPGRNLDPRIPIKQEEWLSRSKLFILRKLTNNPHQLRHEYKAKPWYSSVPASHRSYTKWVSKKYPHHKCMTSNPWLDLALASMYPRDPALDFIL